MSSITPTIGRKVWLWANTDEARGILDSRQACDASICFVNEDGTINVTFADHLGDLHKACNVPIQDSQETDQHTGGGSAYCAWMPYQMGQAKSAA